MNKEEVSDMAAKRYNKRATRDGQHFMLPTFRLSSSAAVIAALMVQAFETFLPTLVVDPVYTGGDRSSRPSRIQRHTGAGGAGMHRAWKRRRASGRR